MHFLKTTVLFLLYTITNAKDVILRPKNFQKLSIYDNVGYFNKML